MNVSSLDEGPGAGQPAQSKPHGHSPAQIVDRAVPPAPPSRAKESLHEAVFFDHDLALDPGSITWARHLRATGVCAMSIRSRTTDRFLMAARRLGVAPERSVAVAASPQGVAAGRAAGFGIVIAVRRDARHKELRAAGAHLVVTDVAQLASSDSSTADAAAA